MWMVIPGNCSRWSGDNKNCRTKYKIVICFYVDFARRECDYAVDLDQSQGLISEFEEDHGWVESPSSIFLSG